MSIQRSNGGFPAIVGAQPTNDAAAGTSHTPSLPAGVAAGELLLVFMAAGADPGTVTSSGFTQLYKANNGTTLYDVCLYKFATGSEGATITVSSTNSVRALFHVFRIDGAGGTAPEAGVAATGTGLGPDPPSVSPSGGSRAYLWVAHCVDASATNMPTAAPSGYYDMFTVAAGAGAETAAQGTAEKHGRAASENPGTFTLGVSLAWIAQTVAVYGA